MLQGFRVACFEFLVTASIHDNNYCRKEFRKYGFQCERLSKFKTVLDLKVIHVHDRWMKFLFEFKHGSNENGWSILVVNFLLQRRFSEWWIRFSEAWQQVVDWEIRLQSKWRVECLYLLLSCFENDWICRRPSGRRGAVAFLEYFDKGGLEDLDLKRYR